MSGLSGLSGRWRPDGRQICMGNIHRQGEKPVEIKMGLTAEICLKGEIGRG